MQELQKRFGKPQHDTAAYLDKLEHWPRPTINNPESFVSFAAFPSQLVQTFILHNFTSDLQSSAVLKIAKDKLAPAMITRWNEYVLRQAIVQPNLIHFKDWIDNYAEACEDLPTSQRPTNQENSSSRRSNRLFQQQSNKRCPLCHYPLCPLCPKDVIYVLYVTKAVNIFRKRPVTNSYEDARRHLLRQSQHKTFSYSIRYLERGKELDKRDKLSQFTPFLDKDLIRARGTLKHAKIAYSQKHPSGDPLRWQEWFSFFKATILDNITLTDAQRMTYLQNALTDRAKDSIIGYSYNGEFYNSNARITKTIRETIRQELLDSKNSITKLIIEQAHNDCRHLGTEFVRAHLQQHFIIIGLRRFLKQLIKTCFICRRWRAQNITLLMADLPSFRFAEAEKQYLFLNVGLDFFGPFYVEHRNRKLE